MIRHTEISAMGSYYEDDITGWGNTTVSGITTVWGNITVRGTIKVWGNITAWGNITVWGNIIVWGSITVWSNVLKDLQRQLLLIISMKHALDNNINSHFSHRNSDIHQENSDEE